MRKVLVFIMISCFSCAVLAQESSEISSFTDNAGVLYDAEPLSDIRKTSLPASSFDMTDNAFMSYHGDSLALPRLNMYGQTAISSYPFYGLGYTDWSLHKGLNVNIGASVFATFGKHSHYKGAGFGQNISMMYAMPITNKLSVALGGYFTNTSWSHDSYRDAGLNAVLGYKFNERWEAYLFAQKSLVNKRMPLPLYDVNGLGDRIGAAVKYNFSPSFSIQMSVSASQYDLPIYTDTGFPPMR